MPARGGPKSLLVCAAVGYGFFAPIPARKDVNYGGNTPRVPGVSRSTSNQSGRNPTMNVLIIALDRFTPVTRIDARDELEAGLLGHRRAHRRAHSPTGTEHTDPDRHCL